MIALYLIAAHMVGDFLLQNRWQAAGKLRDRRLRLEHVAAYVVPFVPIAAVYGTWLTGAVFVAALFLLHYATDSRRFQSTLGDVIQWRLDAAREPLVVRQAWLDHVLEGRGDGPRAIDVSDEAVRWPIPNPWPPMPLLIDQTLHVCQIALLAGILLA